MFLALISDFFSSNVNLEAVATLRVILYSFAVVFVYIFAFCDEEKKLMYLMCNFSV